MIDWQIPPQYIMFRYEYGECLCLLPVVLFILRDTVGIKYSAVTRRTLRYRAVALSLDFSLNMPVIVILGIYTMSLS